MRIVCLVLAGICAASSGWAATQPISLAIGAPETPGPTAASFAKPPYQCTNNVYVAPTGNDAAAGTVAAPWATIQRADTAATAGTCVNVQPGTYASGAILTHGGNAASPTGYVVYRCMMLLACKITDSNKGFSITGAGAGPNYVMIDGFEMAAAAKAAYGVGINVWNSGDKAFGVHHFWALNNRIHGYGQSGLQLNDGDWFYALHNETYGNSNITCDAQGSGISLVVLKALPGYSPTAMDLQWAPFHVLVDWNVAHDNALTTCGTAANPYDTDGNGVIMDTFDNQGSTNVLFPYQSRVGFNVAYRNGGKGIWTFRSSFVTIANNTSYNNNLDPFNNATFRPEIGIGGGHQNTVVNNIALPVPGTTAPLTMNAALGGGDAAGELEANNIWQNNLNFGGTPPYGWGPSGNVVLNGDTAAFSCTSNLCNVSPSVVNAGGSNFALQSGSPAIAHGQVQTWLPAASIDLGACYRSLAQCP